MRKQFVDKDINSYTDKKAEELLLEKNDNKFFIKDFGIKEISKERWEEAQIYEKNTWCKSSAKNMTDDRNFSHEKNFGGYDQLNFLINTWAHINIIELGCGPFTNLRLIISKLYKNFNNIDLLDPLIDEYAANTPTCVYKNGYLNSYKVNLINSSIEDFNADKCYDLIVMINVLQHVLNADIIFDKLIKMMDENSIILFHDFFVRNTVLEEYVNDTYNAGHPIKLSESYLKTKLPNFKIMYKNILDSDEHLVEYYLILKKK